MKKHGNHCSTNTVSIQPAPNLRGARRDIRAKRSGHLPTVDATVTQAQSVTGGQNFFGTDTTEQTIYGLQLTVPYTGANPLTSSSSKRHCR